ncbi:MAG: rhodanese-like domain-containing protein [Candidatus Marinimicrobia bacterium]|nr:rhodanese-like domain-containing protein [Candidatus Neomarinimicrobiota bacterium]
MKLDWRLVLVMVLSLGLMVSCESTDDEETAATAFETLSKYMVDNDMDATTVVAGWTIGASTLSGNEANYFVVDIRSADVYATGHIPGAVNCARTDILTTVEDGNTNNLPVVVTCYSGQSATLAVVALRLSGYTDAKSLLWGMSGWATQFDSWSSKVDSVAKGNTNWVTTAAPTHLSGNAEPEIVTEYTDGSAILAERVELMLASTKSVAGADVLAAPENYEIINFWGATDYDHYGHIAGAYQVTPDPNELTIANDGLDILDPAQTIVTYCWTGQTSGMVTSWLRVLGYDATSLSNGANSMIYHKLEGHKWGALATSYDMETGL